MPHKRGNHDGKACLRMLGGAAQSENPTLPCRQWTVHGQCLHCRLQCTTTELVILRCQCPLPEQHCGASHQGPTRADQDLDALCHEQVEENDPNMPVALCHEAHQ